MRGKLGKILDKAKIKYDAIMLAKKKIYDAFGVIDHNNYQWNGITENQLIRIWLIGIYFI